MSKPFKLPDPGEGLHEAEILEVLVAEGDAVEEGDELFSVETDKAAIGIPAPFTGTIDEIRVREGDRANVGDTLLTYSEGESDQDEESEGTDSPSAKPATNDNGDGDRPDRDRSDDDGSDEDQPDEGRSEEDQPDEDEQPESETATAPDRESDRESGPDKGRGREAGDGRATAAAPATRRLADELGVDLEHLEGNGPDGRVEEADVRQAAKQDEQQSPRGGADELPDLGQWGPVEETPFRGIRRRIAERMDRAWRTIPHVVHNDFFDVTELEESRRELAHEFEQNGSKLTLTVFAVKAVAAALKEFPRFNASLDAGNGVLYLKGYYHVGVAVATDNGLLVPVIRNADRKSLAEIASELVQLADRAREGELKAAEMRGGSITITNPGAIGASTFSPIINYPEVAIVGLGTARTEPVAVFRDGEPGLEYRIRLPLSLSFDHRVNDGADAARFAARIGELLESPQQLLLKA